MSYALQRNIGAAIKTAKAFKPRASAAATINGDAIDRWGFSSAVLHHQCGDATGTPSAQTVNTKLQHSDASGSGFVDVSPAVTLTELAANDGAAEKDVDLSGMKRYIRLVTTVAFTGGSSPAIPVAASVTLGGAESLPQ